MAALPPQTFLGALQGCGSTFLPFRYLMAYYGLLDAEGGRTLVPARLRDLLDEAFPLMAEDLRSVRLGLRITSTTAAERAGLDLAVYRALEEGNVERTRQT